MKRKNGWKRTTMISLVVVCAVTCCPVSTTGTACAQGVEVTAQPDLVSRIRAVYAPYRAANRRQAWAIVNGWDMPPAYWSRVYRPYRVPRWKVRQWRRHRR